MSYLHCHSCGWSQDDFYSEYGYNPANYLINWMGPLCSNKLDDQFTNDPKFIKHNGNLSLREVIAREFEKFAENIREMKWVTFEQWQRDKKFAVCPKCGNKNFDID